MYQAHASFWNRIAETQSLKTEWAKRMFSLTQDALLKALEQETEELKKETTSNRVRLAYLEIMPLLWENEAISGFCLANPGLRAAMPQIESVPEAVAIADRDYPMTQSEQRELSALLTKGPLSRNPKRRGRGGTTGMAGDQDKTVVAESCAAAAEELVRENSTQAAVVNLLSQDKSYIAREVGLLIGEVPRTGFGDSEQPDMFGTMLTPETLRRWRVKLFDAVLRALQNDRQFFSNLVKHADEIEARRFARFDRGACKRHARATASLRRIVACLGQSEGPVSDALSRAAADIISGKTAEQAVNAFLGEMQRIIEHDGSLARASRRRRSQQKQVGMRGWMPPSDRPWTEEEKAEVIRRAVEEAHPLGMTPERIDAARKRREAAEEAERRSKRDPIELPPLPPEARESGPS